MAPALRPGALRTLYRQLEDAYPGFTVADWWGVDDPLLRTWGSVLVQFTAWEPNARRALAAVVAAGAAGDPAALAAVPPDRLEGLIRPAGLYRQKAATLRRLAGALAQLPGGLAALAAAPPEGARAWLLAIPGIGPETADCIMLYALGQPTFQGDAYARRLLIRTHGLSRASYAAVRSWALRDLGPDLAALQRLHGLVVEHGKARCLKQRPRCSQCPLPCRYRETALTAAPEQEDRT